MKQFLIVSATAFGLMAASSAMAEGCAYGHYKSAEIAENSTETLPQNVVDETTDPRLLALLKAQDAESEQALPN